MLLKKTTVLVADDDDATRALCARILESEGFDVVTAEDGTSVLSAVPRNAPDIVLLNMHLPAPDGLEVCRQLKADPTTRLVPVVLITGQSEIEDRMQGVEAGADDFLSTPVHAGTLRARLHSLARLKWCLDEFDSSAAAFMKLATAIEARDPMTHGHCERLGRYAVAIGEAVGLDAANLKTLSRGGYLHDVGNVGIPDAVLLKPGRLTSAELELMKQHPEIGDGLCASLQSLNDVRPIVRHHHERLDGSGYPCGLRGDEIPLLAQVVAVADVYDALTTARPYRPALSHSKVVKTLLADVHGGKLAARLVAALLDRTAEKASPLSEVANVPSNYSPIPSPAVA